MTGNAMWTPRVSTAIETRAEGIGRGRVGEPKAWGRCLPRRGRHQVWASGLVRPSYIGL